MQSEDEKRSSMWFIQCYFSFFKQFHAEADTFLTLAKSNEALSEEDIINLQKYSGVFKMENLLKTLLKRGENSCYNFIKAISNRPEFSEIVKTTQTLHYSQNEREPHNATENKEEIAEGNSTCFTKQDLVNHLDYIHQNLQVSKVLDGLFEYGVLLIDEHDQVQQNALRKEKRIRLMEILFQKTSSTWIKPFANVLRLNDNELFQHLQNGKSDSEAHVTASDPSDTVQLGHTNPAQFRHFVGYLRTDSNEELTDDYNQENAEQTFQECLDAKLIDDWYGSIYFHIITDAPAIIDAVLSGSDDEPIRRFLQQLFHRNKDLLKHLRIDRVHVFELQEKPDEEFLDHAYGKHCISYRESDEDNCSGCFLATVKKNYELILDEIEDDIIHETLDTCLVKGKDTLIRRWKGPRIARAVHFLQYVMANKRVLMTFKKVLFCRSQMALASSKCRICSGEGCFAPDILKKEFHFTIKVDEKGAVKIDLKSIQPSLTIEKEYRGNRMMRGFSCAGFPSDQDNVLCESIIPTQQEDSVLCRQGLTKDLHWTDVQVTGKKELRIVLIPNTELQEAGTVFLSSAKGVEETVLKIIPLPTITKHQDAFNEKQDSLAHAIALSSPGPHAFMLMTSMQTTNLEETIRSFLTLFGRNTMQFLVLVLITDSTMDGTESFLANSSYLKQILRKCEDRFIIFDPTSAFAQRLVQVRKLVHIIRKTLHQNKTTFYSNEMFRQSEKEIKRQEAVLINQKLQKIKRLEMEIQNIDGLRSKAAEQISHQRGYLDIVNSICPF